MKLGIIGTGNMARQMTRAAQSQGIDIAAVLSADLARAESFCAAQAPGARACSDMSAFLASVSAVYIATEPARHVAAIEAAIGAGRAILCEKPLTPSAAQTRRVVRMAQDAGVLLMEAIWTLTLPAFRALEDRVDGTGRVTFDFSYPLPTNAGAHFNDPDVGGVLIDRGVYGFAAAITLLGPIVTQHALIARNPGGADTSAIVSLTHQEGGTSVLTLSFDHVGSNRLDYASAVGTAVLGPPSLAAERLQWHDFVNGPETAAPPSRLKASSVLRRVKQTLTATRAAFHGYGASHYGPVIAEFANAVRAGLPESRCVPLQLSVDIAAHVAEARKS